MTIDVKAVREYLDNLSEDRVKSEVVQRWIDLATAQVTAEKSEIATADVIDNAVLAIAGHHVYLAYASKYERTIGMHPAPVLMNLQIYERLAGYYLGIAMRGTVGTAPVMGLVKSLITEVRDGNYEV
jgi:hypothetical protein